MQGSDYSFSASEHGKFTITVDDRVIIVRCCEAWNLEAALHYCVEMEKAGKTLAGKPWAILSDLTQWQLSTPEVGEEVAAMAVTLDGLGRTHNAIVASDHGLRHAIVAEAIRSQTQNPVLKFFDDEDAAFRWLQECGFSSRHAR